SIKYCAHSQPMIKIYSENNQGYQLIVEDNGIGISEEDIPNIFEAFYRADKSRSRKIAGSGLGLAITKDIIEAHQGKITISSVLNEGTKIIIEFD
ncbi:MAG: ATP-binding protein, partial [Anaerorhabdus sp.]